MFEWLSGLFNWLIGLWERIPDSVKEKIIDMIVETFDAIIREFYRSKRAGD